MKKSAQRDANTARAGCSKVRTRYTARPLQTRPQTGPITIHCAAKLNAQCKNRKLVQLIFSHAIKADKNGNKMPG